MTIVVNDREVATLMCTPRDLRELAVGWLFAEGLIEGPDEIVSLAGCRFERQMLVRTEPDRVDSRDGAWRLVTSGCGAGGNAEALRQLSLRRVRSDFRLGVAQLRRLFREMLQAAKLYQATGGVHSAALTDGKQVLVSREDLGRHNAVDKVIGYGLLHGIDFANVALLATGRLSSEMAWKAARAGVPVAASLSVPSVMAKEVAEAAGLTMVGRAMAAQPWVYTFPERITED